MANREIKTRLTLDGEKEFKQQIASINRELRLGNAQLKETAAAYDLNGNAQEKLAANSRILKTQLDAQNRIVAEYEERLKQARQATDLSADGLRNYEIALVSARTKQKQLEKQVADTDRELEELGRDSRRAGNQLEDNLADAADDVTNRFERMVGSINDSLTDIRNMQGVSLAVDLVRGAWNVGSQMYQWAQGYAEENMKTAMTQYNVQTAGGDWGQTARLAIEYASIFGDKDSALEAISNLTAAGYKDDSLNKMAQYLGGAAIRWQDTLKIESLADSLQESLSEGVLTGQFAELINRLEETTGISQEQVAAQLAEAKKNGQEKEAIEAYLQNAGLSQIYEGFTDQNQAMIDAAVAAGELNQEKADLARELNIFLTPAVKLLGTGLKDVNEMIAMWKDENLTTEEKVIKAVTPTQEEWKAGFDLVNVDYQTGMNAINAYSQWAQIFGQKIATFLGDWMPGGGTAVGKPADTSGGAVDERFGGISEAVKTETDLAAETATEGGENIGSSLWAGLQSQTEQLLAIAQQQRLMLEAVWQEPITPTVVVSYGTAPGATGGKPNIPALPGNVNVSVEIDKRKLGEVVVPLVDSAMGGATGAYTNMWK